MLVQSQMPRATASDQCGRPAAHLGHASGLVAAAFPDAARAGAAMLERGGNAIDAACAAAWALGVCEPAESGLGGHTTMLLRLADGRRLVIDGHSHAPREVTRERVTKRSQSMGIRATTVPSTPRTLELAQLRFGRLSPAVAIEPAIALAADGYQITRLQRRLLQWVAPRFTPRSPEAALFLDESGRVPKRGARFRQPALAETLSRLQAHGISDFYEGELARTIAADMEARGGLLTRDDLRNYSRPVERTPQAIDFRGHEVISIPPPGGGVQVLMALRLIELIGPPGNSLADWYSVLTRAIRASFRERARWPDHPADMSESIAQWLVSRERARGIADRMASDHPAPQPDDERGNTTHLCAADSKGNVVSLTQSIQSVFGAKVAHPTLGFVYNNYLSACPRRPHPYRLGPGAIPQSNAAPTMVFDSRGIIRLVLGSAGSRRITSSIVQVISAVVERGLGVTAALAVPRVHPLLSGKVWAEESAGADVLSRLRAENRRVRPRRPNSYKMGAVQAIEWVSGSPIGAADPRRDGGVAVAHPSQS